MFPQEICHQSWLLSDSSCDLLASLTDVIYFSSYKRNASFFTYSPHNRTLAYQSFLPFFPSKTTDGRFHRLMNNPAWIVPGGLSSYFLMSPDICRSRPQLSPLSHLLSPLILKTPVTMFNEASTWRPLLWRLYCPPVKNHPLCTFITQTVKEYWLTSNNKRGISFFFPFILFRLYWNCFDHRFAAALCSMSKICSHVKTQSSWSIISQSCITQQSSVCCRARSSRH